MDSGNEAWMSKITLFSQYQAIPSTIVKVFYQPSWREGVYYYLELFYVSGMHQATSAKNKTIWLK